MVPRTLVDHDRCLKRNRNIPPICPLFLGLLKTSRKKALSLSNEILKKCKSFWSFKFWKTNENDTNKKIQNVLQIKTIFLKFLYSKRPQNFFKIISQLFKVQTFWEAHIIWKKFPHGFDVYEVKQLIYQNHEEDFFKSCVFLWKSELY